MPVVTGAASYSKDVVATVTAYQFTATDGFELLEIPGSDYLYSQYKPVLPVLYTTLNLPPGSSVSSLELIGDNAIALGQHNIPSADPPTEYDPTTGYTDITDVTGPYPPLPRYGYVVKDFGDRLEVRIAIAPVTFDVTTRQVTLYDSTTVRIHYTASVPAVISDLTLSKPQYEVGEGIVASAIVDNVGASSLTLTAAVNVYDSADALVASTTSEPFDVAAGATHALQIPWVTALDPGNYRATLTVEEAATPLVAASASFRVMAGKVHSFVAPVARGRVSMATLACHSTTIYLCRSLPPRRCTSTARLA